MSKYCGFPGGYEDSDGDDDERIIRFCNNLKIVPEITKCAGLNGQDFVYPLNPDLYEWFDTFRQKWQTCKRTPVAIHNLEVTLMGDARPCLLALKFFSLCPDNKNLRTKTLACTILETICSLAERHPYLASTLDDNTRMVAFNFTKTCGIVSLYKSVTQAYELCTIRDLLLPKLRQLLQEGKYKDTAYWVLYLDLTNKFDKFDIIFPLILQEKIYIVEEYLNQAKEQQMDVLKFLDSLLDNQKTVAMHCDDILQKYRYKDIKHTILSHRPMVKLVTRLAKNLKLDEKELPNLSFGKTCSYMHYLYRKYALGDTGEESFRELICDTAVTKELQLAFIRDVNQKGNLDEATYWAKFWRIPAEECPRDVRDMFRYEERQQIRKQQQAGGVEGSAEGSTHNDNFDSTADGAAGPAGCTSVNGECSVSTRSNRNKDKYLTLSLPDESIIMVDTEEQFKLMIEDLSKCRLISFDSEWKPNETRVALLQIATMERVYLIDCLTQAISKSDWQRLGCTIFNNLEILKLGFGMCQDLRALHKSLPLCLDLKVTACYLDLREMYRRLKYMQVVRFPYENGGSSESLSSLSQACLGKKIDKSDQCSNWANRPLRYKQKVYAALDAYCLLQIYKVFDECLKCVNIDIDQVVDEVTTAKTGYLFKMKRAAMKQSQAAAYQASTSSIYQNPKNPCGGSQCSGGPTLASIESAAGAVGKPVTYPPDLPATPSSAIKFLCDNMLVGLSRELRKLGIDCVDVNTNQDALYINLAHNERRYVLTQQPRYSMFIRALPQWQCLQIPNDSNVEQVLNILSYLNIVVHERDLHSRCLVCNNKEFILMRREDMQIMCYGHVLPNSNERKRNNLKGNVLAKAMQKPWQLMDPNEHIVRNRVTYRGVPIICHNLKGSPCRTADPFFICNHCGTCCWDGSTSINSAIQSIIIAD